jgi:predicted amidohydrolase YtcJ
MALIVRDAEIDGRRVDVRCERGFVTGIASPVPHRPDDDIIDAAGGAVIAGLHDHHVHVLALAAALDSVRCGPPEVSTMDALVQALRGARRVDWLRGVGYHESVAGPLDRDTLDQWRADLPVRIQHRTGALWMLNSAALTELDLESRRDPRIERDEKGRATGRLWRADDLVRAASATPPLSRVASLFTEQGVTSITDATPTNDPGSRALLALLPQKVRVMGPLGLVTEGEVKVMLDDDALPPLAEAMDLVRAAHAMGRGVAVHCVTLVQLWFAIEVFRSAGVAADRIEHASLAPTEAIGALRELGLRVVTQPAFVAERGDDYLRDVDEVDQSSLYPLRSLLRAGIPVRGSSDAPFGGSDCWAAMRAAVERRTLTGQVLLPSERLEPTVALELFSSGNGGVSIGAPADLAVLAVPLAVATRELDARNVVATIVGGRILNDGRTE